MSKREGYKLERKGGLISKIENISTLFVLTGFSIPGLNTGMILEGTYENGGHRTSNKCLNFVERFFLLFNFQFFKLFNKYSEVI